MKSLFASMSIVLLVLGLAACGGAGGGSGSASQTSSAPVADSDSSAKTVTGATSSKSALKGDSDDDDIGNSTNNTVTTADGDADFDNDYKDSLGKGYYDGDDNEIRRYGHAASPVDRHVLATIVERYYAAAFADDGAAACSLIYPLFAKSIPEDQGQAPGPEYLRGAKTCAAVMSLLFKHFHGQLVPTIHVTGVRVRGSNAFVLVGSKTAPASYVRLKRQHGTWGIEQLLGEPLP